MLFCYGFYGKEISMVFELEINIYGDEPIGKFVKESETQFEITREKLGVIMTEKYQELAGGGGHHAQQAGKCYFPDRRIESQFFRAKYEI